MNLMGYRIFITGGSGGIGAATAREAILQGASVAFSYNKGKQKAEILLKELQSLFSQVQLSNKRIKEKIEIESLTAQPLAIEPLAIPMDLTKTNSISMACQMVLKHFCGQIDGVVNNAGVTQDQILLRMNFEDFDRPIQTNLYGCYLVSKAFLKPMLKTKKGAFVHITSINGQIGQVGQANYAASKAGIEAFSKSLARELASRGIRSNCVAPGLINTEMTQKIKLTQELLSHIPVKKIAEPIEVAKPICFLLSEGASYITGHTLNVNGGLFMN